MPFETRNLICSTAMAFALLGCVSSPSPYGSTSTTSSTARTAAGYGTVQAIEAVPRESSAALGTIGGAILGGVLGNQIGSGSGRTAATVAGAAAGGYAGNRVQKNMNAGDQAYRIAVRMDDGQVQTIMQDSPPNLRTGDRVHVREGAIERVR